MIIDLKIYIIKGKKLILLNDDRINESIVIGLFISLWYYLNTGLIIMLFFYYYYKLLTKTS